MKKSMILLVLGVFLIISTIQVSSVCVATLNEEAYPLGATVTATFSCSAGNEKNVVYVANFTNVTGVQIAIDSAPTGTTPGTAGQDFFEEYVINSTFLTNGGTINITLEGTNLEGEDSATVATGGAGDLIIEDINVTTPNFIGKTLGITARVGNHTGGNVTGAICRADIETASGIGLQSQKQISTAEGDLDFNFLITEQSFDPGKQFLVDINCYCTNVGLSSSCLFGADSEGETSKSFLIDDLGDFMIGGKWLNITSSDNTFLDDDEGIEELVPGVYLRNEFGAKTQIIDGPVDLLINFILSL